MKIAATIVLACLGLLAAGCGESTSTTLTTTTTTGEGDRRGARTMSFAITDAGCEPNRAETTSGLVTFEVENKGAAGVTELEVIKDKRILGEVENLADGLNGHFSLTLQPGEYELYCPNGTTQERGTLTVTGDQVARDDDKAAQKAIATYKAYVLGQAALLEPRTKAFTNAIRAGDIAKAKKLFPTSREPYERIEPVAESFGDLDPQIDARAGDVPAATWTGFHRLEKMLWVENATAAEMKPFADELDADVAKLVSNVKSADYQTAQIANGAKSLMDEIGASKVTGEEDRYSHTDLYDFKANVDGAKAVFDSMHPILQKRAPTLAVTITNAFAEMNSAMEPFRSGRGWVTYTKVAAAERRGLSRSVDALALPLSNMAAIVAQ
jgi:iron uptake system component EfeO